MSDGEQKFLVVIGGATATGKTDAAIRIARLFETEIISADSRQLYKELSIGTAKPSDAELSAVRHHFVGSISIRDKYSVGQYEAEAVSLMAHLHQRHQVVVLVGGSGLYLKAVCEGLDNFPDVPDHILSELNLAAERPGGLQVLQEELARLDPVYHRVVDLRNPRRLIRALSICRTTGLPYAHFLGKGKKTRDFTPVYLQLSMDRQECNARIDARVERMMAAGLEQEAHAMLPFRHLQALQTVGYQEMFRYFDGEIPRESAVALIQRHTRQYAKRQETWFRNQGNWFTCHPNDFTALMGHLREAGCPRC